MAAAKKPINLALQGGGAHGAFTWGVLEALLQDGRVDFHTISATSSGAMNAAVMVTGLLRGGPDEAVRTLEGFWHQVSEAGRFGLFAAPNAFQDMMGAGSFSAGAFRGFDIFSSFFSPYQFNPLAYNPLQKIIDNTVDFALLHKSEDITLHVCATDVRKSQLKIFSGKELSVDALLASACLPQLFQAVEIGGHVYWDGGYMGNPALFPLTHSKASCDILIVQVDPLANSSIPKTGDAIADRVNEISFNSPLLAELRGLERINRLIQDGHLNPKKCGLRELYIHLISDDAHMAALSLDSKFNPEWGFLQSLREAGHNRTKHWLSAHFDDLGQKSSVDLKKLLALDVD
jgi:NTE family protein